MKKYVMSTLLGMTIGAGITKIAGLKKKDKVQLMSDKHLALFLMMNQWVKVKQEGKSLSDYFEKTGYRNIAVYGMSYAGERLIDELNDTSIHVEYGIDKKADTIYSDIEIVSLDADLRAVDAVVVTAITFFNEITDVLANKVNCPIISLEDILYKM